VAIFFPISLCTTPKDILIIIKLNITANKSVQKYISIAQSKDGEYGYV